MPSFITDRNSREVEPAQGICYFIFWVEEIGMARDYRIGPYVSYRAQKSPTGFHRITYEDLEPQMLFDIGSDLDKFGQSSSRQYDSAIVSEFKDVVFGFRRPLDDIIRRVWLYTDLDFWREHHARWMPSYPHRVCVNAHITSHDNLSVTLSARCLSPQGTWDAADEWKFDPFWGQVGFRQRPLNEALFLRDVSALFQLGRVPRSIGARTRSVQCKAVLASFWLTMERLSLFFEPHYGNYIVGLTENPVTWENPDEPLVGLEIVDGLAEYREWLRQEFSLFEGRAGHSAESFYDICEETRSGLLYEQTSKKIRHSSRGSVDLVPSAIRDLHDFLNTVKGFGIWKPDTSRFELRNELRNELRCWAEKYNLEPQIAVGVWYYISERQLETEEKVDVLRLNHNARIEIDGKKFEQDLDRISDVMRALGIEPKRYSQKISTKISAKVTLPPKRNGDDVDKTGAIVARRRHLSARSALDGSPISQIKPSSPRKPPNYPARTFNPSGDELANLGVADTHELVRRLNEKLIADRQFPITSGDYPTTKAKFQKIAKRWEQINGNKNE
jgi:hypothetical protein